MAIIYFVLGGLAVVGVVQLIAILISLIIASLTTGVSRLKFDDLMELSISVIGVAAFLGFPATFVIYYFDLFDFKVIHETIRGVENPSRVNGVTYIRSYLLVSFWIYILMFFYHVMKKIADMKRVENFRNQKNVEDKR